MIPAEGLAAATGLAVFLGFPLARWVSERLVIRADQAWQASSLEWLEGQGGPPPKAISDPIYPSVRDLGWRGLFTAIALMLGYTSGGTLVAALFVVICMVAACAAVADLRAQILPDLLVGSLGILGIVLSVIGEGAMPRDALIGLAAGGGVFWALSRGYAAMRGREGLGLGDVKLFAAAGLFVGWVYLPFVALLAVLITIGTMVLNGALKWTDQSRMPFGPAIAAATLVVLGILRL